MKTDLLFDPFGGRWADVRAGALAAADAGFDGIWTWDHLAGEVHGVDHVLECWTVLAAIAATTPHLSIGPLVLNVANREPGLVAVMAATLQEVAGGRLLLGLGAGGGRDTPYALEQEALGRPVPGAAARRANVERAIAEIRRVWTGAGVGFLRPSPPPPIVIGGFGPKMAELAGRLGDGINTPAGPLLERLVDIARAAHESSGRDPAAFVATTSGPFTETWADPGSRERQRLARAGVDRVILHVGPPYDHARIAAVGRHLR